MTYIPNVNADSDIVVVNGDFAVDANWNKSPAWTIAAGKATMAVVVPGLETLTQANALFVLGNTYEVTFTLANVNFPVGGDGIQVSIGDNWDGIVYNANGTFTSKITYLAGIKQLQFGNRLPVQPSDCDLDNVSIVPLTSYAESELEINWRRPQAACVYPVAGGDRIYHQLAYRDKTNCIIKYTP